MRSVQQLIGDVLDVRAQLFYGAGQEGFAYQETHAGVLRRVRSEHCVGTGERAAMLLRGRHSFLSIAIAGAPTVGRKARVSKDRHHVIVAGEDPGIERLAPVHWVFLSQPLVERVRVGPGLRK